MCFYGELQTTSGYFPKTNINIRARCLVSLEQPIWKRSSGKGTDCPKLGFSRCVPTSPTRIATRRENLRRKILSYPPSLGLLFFSLVDSFILRPLGPRVQPLLSRDYKRDEKKLSYPCQVVLSFSYFFFTLAFSPFRASLFHYHATLANSASRARIRRKLRTRRGDENS